MNSKFMRLMIKIIVVKTLIVCFAISAIAQHTTWQGPSVVLSHGKLEVSENKRFLVFEDGTPFFYLGDTAWELFHRLSKTETEKYLKDRSKKGFTVIQAVALAEIDGLNVPNTEGEKPLINNDPTTPNEKYFAHVDWVIKKAEENGLFIALLPTWGDKWNKRWGVGPEVFTPYNAKQFGLFLGSRYKNNPNIIWVVGGDRPVETELHHQIITQMALGLKEGDDGRHLISFHPSGGKGSAEYFHEEPWLDFNMRQNGHSDSYTERYYMTLQDYHREPVKPVFDGEPIYEDHPINFKPNKYGHSSTADVRRPLYWNLFNGAFGHTYGHHSIWQMWEIGREPINFPLMPWDKALDQPGAWQMQYGRRLIESRPFLTRIPDNSVIVTNEIPTSVPGAGTYHFEATRCSNGSYAFVYVPVGRKFRVRMDVIKGEKVIAWWYNPRNGEATKIGDFKSEGEREFLSPTPGENLDWILVLDDAERNFTEPGKL